MNMPSDLSSCVELSTGPCTTCMYSAICTVAVPGPVASQILGHIWTVPAIGSDRYCMVLYSLQPYTGSIRWIQCHHFIMKCCFKVIGLN